MDKYRNFIYLENKKLAFCYVPKVACTNWKCIFRELMGFDDYLDSGKAHDRKNSGLMYMDRIENVESILSDDNVIKACFVRNPYTRILSAYLNKIDRLNKSPELILKDVYFGNVYKEIKKKLQLENEIISFKDFLRWLKRSNLEKSFAHFDEHWRKQSDLLCIDSVNFDFVGTFENLARDSNEFFKLIKSDVVFPSQSDVKFPATKASEKLQKYFDDDCVNLVNDIYERDFEVLAQYNMVYTAADL